MLKRPIRPLHLGILATIVALITIPFPATVLRAQLSPATPKTTDQTFKNIQTLKGIPADQLIPTMQFISASLGMEFEFCHVEGAFEKDDKKPKQTARKMMEMVFGINKVNFENRREVTCYSCHRGTTQPVGIPIIPAGTDTIRSRSPTITASDARADNQGTNLAAVVEPIVEKYIAALGGTGSIQKVTTRIEKGSADLAGKQFPIEIYSHAPDKRITVMHLPNGDSITAYNGSAGGAKGPRPPLQWMTPA